MKKDTLIHLCTFALSLAVILGASSLYYGNRASVLDRALTQQSERALSAMTARLDSLDTALRKTSYVPGGAMRSMLAAEIWRQSESAKAALSVLPLSEAHLDQYESWLSQTGGYAWSLLRDGLYDTSDETAVDNLAACTRVSSTLRSQLSDLKEKFDAGEAAFTAPARGQGTAITVSTAFQTMEESFPDFEPLNYDGPFSAHILRQTPRGIVEYAEFSAEQARASAENILGSDTGSLSLEYESSGALPFYCFTNGSGLSVRITKAGGRLLGLTNERAVNIATLSSEQATEIGLKWLEDHSFANMTAGYARQENGVASIQFYSMQGDAICYPDLISLGVALDDGSIVRMDATGYFMNHTSRQMPSNDLAGFPPEGMTVVSSRLAVIPTAGQKERWCREYLCESGSGKALCYIGCESGEIEELLMLDDTGSGILVH